MKKVISVILVVFVLALSSLALYSCGNKKPTIGIIQFGSHASLNNCYDGVIAGLEESGIKLDDYNIEQPPPPWRRQPHPTEKFRSCTALSPTARL